MTYFVSSSCVFSWIRCSTSRPIPTWQQYKVDFIWQKILMHRSLKTPRMLIWPFMRQRTLFWRIEMIKKSCLPKKLRSKIGMQNKKQGKGQSMTKINKSDTKLLRIYKIKTVLTLYLNQMQHKKSNEFVLTSCDKQFFFLFCFLVAWFLLLSSFFFVNIFALVRTDELLVARNLSCHTWWGYNVRK